MNKWVFPLYVCMRVGSFGACLWIFCEGEVAATLMKTRRSIVFPVFLLSNVSWIFSELRAEQQPVSRVSFMGGGVPLFHLKSLLPLNFQSFIGGVESFKFVEPKCTKISSISAKSLFAIYCLHNPSERESETCRTDEFSQGRRWTVPSCLQMI